MPSLRDYHILISHSWDYSSDYETIKRWLDEAPNFMWTNYSVPLTNPLDVNGKRGAQHRAPLFLIVLMKTLRCRSLPDDGPPERSSEAEYCGYWFCCLYASAFSFMRTARFSLSGCDANIFWIALALSPPDLESSTSLFSAFDIA